MSESICTSQPCGSRKY